MSRSSLERKALKLLQQQRQQQQAPVYSAAQNYNYQPAPVSDPYAHQYQQYYAQSGQYAQAYATTQQQQQQQQYYYQGGYAYPNGYTFGSYAAAAPAVAATAAAATTAGYAYPTQPVTTDAAAPVAAAAPVPAAAAAVPPPPPPPVVAAPVPPPAPPAVVEEETEEVRRKKKDELPIHGNDHTFNMNPMLSQNIYKSDYFKSLYELKTFHEVLNEINERVRNVEPWATGTSRIASTAFCLLKKLFTMRLTVKQIQNMLDDEHSPYIRCLGFLYLRFGCDPKDLWGWFEPYLEDEEVVHPASDESVEMTIGQYCAMLLKEMNYYGTMLPRIPVKTERTIKIMLLLLEQKQQRRNANRKIVDRFQVGTRVSAIYVDEEAGPQWYDAVIDAIEDSEMYRVTFPEYGNTEIVDLGDMKLPDTDAGESKRSDSRERDNHRAGRDSRSRSRTRSGSAERRRRRDRDRERDDSHEDERRRRYRSRSRSRDRARGRSHSRSKERGGAASTQNLMEEVLRREREKSAAVGKGYAQRPASYKGSLSLKLDTFTARQKSRSRSPPPRSRRSPKRDRAEQRRSKSNSPEPEKRVVSAEALERQRKLLERYGDASSNPKQV